MAAGENQKLKMLYLVKIFSEETDESHALTLQEIIDRLGAYGVNAERRTLYQDLELLEQFGLDIIREQVGRGVYYHLGSRAFELPELKLLVDSVQSAKFITERKSRELIKKLEALVSRNDASHLHRQVVIAGRVKTVNESIYYNVDLLHEAIGAGRQIRFRYYRWNVKKEMELRRGGAWYTVSPWCLMWDDENYYMVAYDAEDAAIKHYRVDKMVDLRVTDEPRLGRKEGASFDLARYGNRLFGMFGGEEVRVSVRGENRMVGVFIDRFGKDLIIIPDGEEHFTTSFEAAISGQFLGWIVSLGSGVQITGPESVVRKMKAEAERLSAQYCQRGEARQKKTENKLSLRAE